MSTNKNLLLRSTVLAALFITASCGNNDKKQTASVSTDSNQTAVKKEEKKDSATKFERPPIVNIVDTLEPKRTVIYCKDSAANMERVGLKLGKIYGGKLADYIKKNKLTMAGAPMAWYAGAKAPYFFDAGVPVNKPGDKAIAGVMLREMNAGKAVIAHFFGPYEQLSIGYDAVREFIKDNKKTIAGLPYEIYLSDPVGKDGKPVDPYKVQTDIVFPIK